jgi:hypothetical protein
MLIVHLIIFIFLIILYKKIYNYLNNIYKELNVRDSAIYDEPRKKYKSYKKLFNKIIPVLLFIQKWRNPILVFLLYTDKKLFNIMRYIYELWKRKGYKQEKREIINLIIIYILYFGTFKVLFGFFFKFLSDFLILDFIILLRNKFNNLLIISFIIIFILYIIKIYSVIKVFIYIYIILSLILIIIQSLVLLKLYNFNWLIKLNELFYNYSKVDTIIYNRMHYTILGRIITIISEVILDLEEDTLKALPFAKIGSYIGSKSNSLNQQIFVCSYRYRYSAKYMDNVSCHFQIKYNYLEITFLTYWTFLKRNYYNLDIILFQNRIKYPSSYLFYSLILSFNSLFGPGIPLTELYYYKLKFQENHIVLNEKEMYNFEYLYKFDILRLKLVSYILWDIIEIIDFDKYSMLSIDKMYLFNSVVVISKINDISNLKVIKISNQIYNLSFVLHHYKKKIKFYDIESNLVFFVKLFEYLGFVIPGFVYKDMDDSQNINMCGRMYCSKILESYSWKLYLRKDKYNDFWGFNRSLDKARYEDIIELHFKNVIHELQKEWLELKKIETLENRNIRLLNELSEVSNILFKLDINK